MLQLGDGRNPLSYITKTFVHELTATVYINKQCVLNKLETLNEFIFLTESRVPNELSNICNTLLEVTVFHKEN